MNIAHLANNLPTLQTLELALSITGRSKTSFATQANLGFEDIKRYFKDNGPHIRVKTLDRLLRDNGIEFSLHIGEQLTLTNQLSAQIALAHAQKFLQKPQAHLAVQGVNARTLRRIQSGETDTSPDCLAYIFAANSVPFRFIMRFENPIAANTSRLSASSASPLHL